MISGPLEDVLHLLGCLMPLKGTSGQRRQGLMQIIWLSAKTQGISTSSFQAKGGLPRDPCNSGGDSARNPCHASSKVCCPRHLLSTHAHLWLRNMLGYFHKGSTEFFPGIALHRPLSQAVWNHNSSSSFWPVSQRHFRTIRLLRSEFCSIMKLCVLIHSPGLRDTQECSSGISTYVKLEDFGLQGQLFADQGAAKWRHCSGLKCREPSASATR